MGDIDFENEGEGGVGLARVSLMWVWANPSIQGPVYDFSLKGVLDLKAAIPRLLEEAFGMALEESMYAEIKGQWPGEEKRGLRRLDVRVPCDEERKR